MGVLSISHPHSVGCYVPVIEVSFRYVHLPTTERAEEEPFVWQSIQSDVRLRRFPVACNFFPLNSPIPLIRCWIPIKLI